MDSTTQPYSSPRLYSTRPPLCSSASVLDTFVVNGAAAYALTASLPENKPDSSEILRAWRDYFLAVFQRESSYREKILQCQPQDAQHTLDAMQELSKVSWIEEPFKMVLEVALLRSSQEHLLYPGRLTLDNVISDVHQSPLRITAGRVIQASFNGAVVSIKVSGLRLGDRAGIVSKHILSWTLLKHENVLTPYGVCTIVHYNKDGLFDRLGLVSPFLENGNITKFLDKHPAHRAAPYSFILDVAAGMAYLHENGIVHGQIHCHNILVANTHPPRACLADFGLAHVMGADTGLPYKFNIDSLAERRINHFLAPEDDTSTNSFSQTEASDVYAFSMASRQILARRFAPAPVEMEMALRPDDLDPWSQNMMQQLITVDCCQPDPKKRPTARYIVSMLKNIIGMDKGAYEEMILHLKENVQTSLNLILNNVEYHRRLISSNGPSTQRILDAFQVLLDTRENQRSRTQLIAAMQRISEHSELYPDHFFLDDSVTTTGDGPITAGGLADIYMALFQGKEVCLKLIRFPQVNHVTKVFAREAIVWAQLSHPNVLPFLGLTRYRERLCFVSCWATNGDLESYLKYNPHANRLLLCSDTAAGVEYLHKNDIVHGDLKGLNVLVDASGRAALGDFGLSNVTDPQILYWTSQSTAESKGGTTRWQAPELLNADSGTARNTKESDVFAWASVCYEIFTGRLPYFESPKPLRVMNKILGGATPTRPNDNDIAWQKYGLKEDIWTVMQNCWKFEPHERLNMTEVISRLDVAKPVDIRPPLEWKEDASMRFRNPQSNNLSLLFWVQLDELLSPIISSSS